MSEYSRLFNKECQRNILGPEFLVGSHRMLENSGVVSHGFHCKYIYIWLNSTVVKICFVLHYLCHTCSDQDSSNMVKLVTMSSWFQYRPTSPPLSVCGRHFFREIITLFLIYSHISYGAHMLSKFNQYSLKFNIYFIPRLLIDSFLISMSSMFVL